MPRAECPGRPGQPLSRRVSAPAPRPSRPHTGHAAPWGRSGVPEAEKGGEAAGGKPPLATVPVCSSHGHRLGPEYSLPRAVSTDWQEPEQSFTRLSGFNFSFCLKARELKTSSQVSLVLSSLPRSPTTRSFGRGASVCKDAGQGPCRVLTSQRISEQVLG